MQGVTIRAVVTKTPVEFDRDGANGQGGNELIDEHAGQHAHHERHDFIGAPQQQVDRIVDGFRNGNGFHNDLREG